MMNTMRLNAARTAAAACLSICLGITPVSAQQLNESAVIQHIDAAAKARFENVLGYTVTEHYAVFRGSDETHPVAQMIVKTVYNKDTGKSYTVLSKTGPEILQKMAFDELLANEKRINQPGNREASWFTSANYVMKLKPGGTQRLDGRDCVVVTLTPKKKAPNLIEGTMWVDANDYSTVQIQGIASHSPSLFAGPTQMMRQYAKVDGYAQATHAKAISKSRLFGQTIVTIDYVDYIVQLRPSR
jgi:outer membrane lipoprotein-sorting protein